MWAFLTPADDAMVSQMPGVEVMQGYIAQSSLAPAISHVFVIFWSMIALQNIMITREIIDCVYPHNLCIHKGVGTVSVNPGFDGTLMVISHINME